jgi:hypothetical protein
MYFLLGAYNFRLISNAEENFFVRKTLVQLTNGFLSPIIIFFSSETCGINDSFAWPRVLKVEQLIIQIQ